MSFSALIAILASAGNVLLGIFTLSRNSRSLVNRLLAVLALASAGWSIANFVSLQVTTPGLALFLTRLVMFFVVLQTSSFFLLMFSFPGQSIQIRPRLKIAYIIFSSLTLAVTLSPILFVGLDPTKSLPPPVPLPGPGMLFFLPHALISVFGGVYRLLKKLRQSEGIEKAQWRYIWYATLALFTLVPLSNFVAVIAFRFSGLIILSPLYTLLFVGLISYAIVRHRFLDIRAIVARSVSYLLVLVSMGALFTAGFYLATVSFLGKFVVSRGQLLTSASLALILAFLFQPLRRLFERITNRLFFHDRYDTQEVINEITKVLAAEIILDRLLGRSLELICKSMRVEYGQFMVYEQGRVYKVSNFGAIPKRIFTTQSLKPFESGLTVSDELPPGDKKEAMQAHGVRVIVPLHTKEKFVEKLLVGFLLLGDKSSGEIYSQQDLDLLEILQQEMAIAISNSKAYEEIQKFNITLQKKIDDATKELRKANENLKALDKTKDEFLSMASHQLRTPLTTIKGYISMLAEGDAGPMTPQQKEFLTYALEGSMRMVGLISDLLNVSRMSSGKFIIDKSPVDVCDMVADEVRQLQTHATQKNLELKFEPPKTKPPIVDIDEGKTRQVIMNFIDNALYYTKQGSVTVSVESDPNAIRVLVKDTGIGVPPEAQAKLFTKFFRADNAQATRPDGTGLGLYLAKRVVEDQGGKIIFDSTVGKGSTFGFEIPLSPKEKAHATDNKPK